MASQHPSQLLIRLVIQEYRRADRWPLSTRVSGCPNGSSHVADEAVQKARLASGHLVDDLGVVADVIPQVLGIACVVEKPGTHHHKGAACWQEQVHVTQQGCESIRTHIRSVTTCSPYLDPRSM